MRVRLIGVDFDRAPIFGQCFIELSFFDIGAAQIVMRFDIIRPDIDSATIVRNRLVELALIFEGKPEIIFCHPASWVLCERGLVKGNDVVILCALMKGQCAKDR